jgi:hypothetical protein
LPKSKSGEPEFLGLTGQKLVASAEWEAEYINMLDSKFIATEYERASS